MLPRSTRKIWAFRGLERDERRLRSTCWGRRLWSGAVMKSPSDHRPGELIFALALLAFSVVAFYEAYGISGFSGLTTGGVLPMLAAGVMTASALMVMRDLLKRRTVEGRASLRDVAAFLLPARLLLFVGLLALYALAIPRIGFIAASGGFLFVSIAFLRRRGLVWSAVVSLVAIIAVYVIFRLIFQVVLPTGSLWS